jgi:hypothetical protein
VIIVGSLIETEIGVGIEIDTGIEIIGGAEVEAGVEINMTEMTITTVTNIKGIEKVGQKERGIVVEIDIGKKTDIEKEKGVGIVIGIIKEIDIDTEVRKVASIKVQEEKKTLQKKVLQSKKN